MQILPGDTFNHLKAQLLSNIKLNMELVETFKRGIERNPEYREEYTETLNILNEEMKQDVAELIDLKKQRIKLRLEDDEVYELQSQKGE